jgi:hypothetical protein
MAAEWRGPYMAATQHRWDDERRVEVYRSRRDPFGPDGQPWLLKT